MEFAYVPHDVMLVLNHVFISMGWFLIISMPITVLLCLKFVPDKVSTTQGHTRLADIKSVFSTNPAYIRCLIAIFLTFFAASATSGVLLFALKWVWGLEEQSSSLLLLFFLLWITINSALSRNICQSGKLISYGILAHPIRFL